MNKLQLEYQNRRLQHFTRRHFLRDCSLGLGALALGGLTGCSPKASSPINPSHLNDLQRLSHFQPKAKHVIFLHMAGAPSQLELFDYKPKLIEYDGQDCPESLIAGKDFPFIQDTPTLLGTRSTFAQYGQSGAIVSDQLTHFKEVVDDVCFLKAVHTDQFNHAPAQLLLHTGSQQLGRPSMGSWVSYGLGSENENLPTFIVLVSGGNTPSAGKSVWGSGFLPSVYQGVQCRSEGDPVLYVNNPKGMPRSLRKKTIDAISRMNEAHYQEVNDPEILTRISQYELAYKMQVTVPEVMDISKEPEKIRDMYGAVPGATSFANNCLLARKLIENGVRFVQLFDWGWDSHGQQRDTDLEHGHRDKCQQIDKPMTALIKDLKQRGLFEETIIVWGGEFGRTPMQENRNGVYSKWRGRDHHTDAFTMWMAGGGIRGGFSYGETDELGYSGVRDQVHIHDLQATILHALGMNHEELTYHFQGRDFRLTDVHGKVVSPVLAV